jgi:hypothetical protein
MYSLNTVNPQIPAGQHGAQRGAIEPGATERLFAVRHLEGRDGHHHDEQLEDTGQDQ